MRGFTHATADLFRRNIDQMRAGLHALRTEEDPPHEPNTLLSSALRFARSVGITMVVGSVVGMFVLGLGGRLAMRISGILAGPAAAGVLTANQNVVGEITLDGTSELMVAGGVFGAFYGPLYAAVRPLLRPFGRRQPLATGILYLLVFGSSFITFQNPDFRRFGPPIVNVILFALLFVTFGMVLASLTSKVDQPVTARDTQGLRASRLRFLVTGLLAIPALALTWQTVVSIGRILTGL